MSAQIIQIGEVYINVSFIVQARFIAERPATQTVPEHSAEADFERLGGGRAPFKNEPRIVLTFHDGSQENYSGNDATFIKSKLLALRF